MRALQAEYYSRSQLFYPFDVNDFLPAAGAIAKMLRAPIVRLPGATLATLLILPVGALADCAQQLQQLSADLRGQELTEEQKQAIGGMVDDARRFCWVHRETPALELLAKARRTAGLRPMSAEFDWETVPLESLERKP
jgi:hypothetical protein